MRLIVSNRVGVFRLESAMVQLYSLLDGAQVPSMPMFRIQLLSLLERIGLRIKSIREV